MSHIELPAEINVTFTEEDRAKAGKYTSISDCILATALKRMGYTELQVGGSGHVIFTRPDDTNEEYLTDPSTPFNLDLARNPIDLLDQHEYRPDIVGRQVKLVKVP